jgi:hypothetical protein
MKVSGTGSLSSSSGARPAKGAGGGGQGFSIAGASAPAAAAPASAAGGVTGVMGVEALLALQDVGTPTDRKRRSVKRAGQLLDSLEDLKVSLLGGELSGRQIENLARAIREQREATDDPQLEAVLDEIETRAAVEMAKLEAARRRA